MLKCYKVYLMNNINTNTNTMNNDNNDNSACHNDCHNTCDMSLLIPRAQDDFYKHVNMKWLNDPVNAIPDEYSCWGGFYKLHDQSLRNQIDIMKALKTKPIDTLNVDELKLLCIWNASMTRFDNWRNKTANYDPLISELNVLRTTLHPDLVTESDKLYITKIAEYMHYTQNTGIENVFRFSQGADFKNSNNNVLE